MSYELLSVPDGYRTDAVLVVAPYVDLVFLNRLMTELKPGRLCLLVDDGIQLEILSRIRDCQRKGLKIEVRIARANGLMHMKAFYFEFVRKQAPRTRKRRLLFGSANATNAAFSGVINAELIAESDLAINADSEIATYFSHILSTFDSPEEQSVPGYSAWLSQTPYVRFPALRSAHPGKLPSGFDAWLQQGVLAAQYRNAPQFATLTIQLKKSLPQDLVARIFARSSFTEKGERNVVRYSYLNGPDAQEVEPAESEQPRWKSRLAVWTHLGDWISNDCHRARSKIMKSKASTARKRNISCILGNGDDDKWIESRIERLEDGLNQVWKELKTAGVAPEQYLEGQNGKVNPKSYRLRFLKKLGQDLQLARDGDFKKRYVHGYEFPAMPRFRQDTMAWEAFVRSWCESIVVETAKNRTLSLVARRIKDVMKYLQKDLSELSWSEIAELLREFWEAEWEGEGMSLGDWIMGYHDDLSAEFEE